MKKPLYIVLTILVIIGIAIVYYREGIIDIETDTAQQDNSEAVVFDEGEQAYGVSANHPIAVEVGMDVLEKGGNAADAAVAVSYVLGVVEPYGSGLGGGGEMLVYFDDENRDPVSYQYKETLPLSGEAPPNKMGVPGFVKGMELINEELGTMPLEELIEPAITYAEEGFKADEHLISRLKNAADRLRKEELEPFFPNGELIEENDIVKQPELAETLKLIQKEGSDPFYKGEIAEAIMAHSGYVTKEDMESYQPVQAEPVHGEFMGYDVYSASPPLSGVTLVQILQMAEVLQDHLNPEDEADYIHLLGEMSKLAYEDRVDHLGDPGFYTNPLEKTTSMEYAKELARSIDMEQITTEHETDDSMTEEDADNTTHFVIVDKNGMVISATNTLGNYFGSGQYVKGFFLNDAMSNFSPKSDSPNKMEPGKTPRSFMSPTILASDEAVIGIGTPGGKRIPMMMSQVIVQHLMFGKDIQEAIDAPRFDIEGNEVNLEEGFSEEVRDELTNRGYYVYLEDSRIYFGGIQALVLDKENNALYGGADKRRGGTWKADK